jgi:probable rRNA maturation factor
MIPKPDGVAVAVRNRQRQLKINTRLLAEIARQALELVGNTRARLGIVLVDDVAIARLNAQYHATPGPTDILSFDYGDGAGELIISVEHAVAQARRFRTTAAREIVLYVVHGILHLRGYNDLTRRDKSRMRAAERRVLAQLGKHFMFGRLITQRRANR